MACFVVPAAEAIITTAVTKVVKAKETDSAAKSNPEQTVKIPFSKKLKWLSNLLWGGSALLTFEHVWHGEVTPWFPFLTAAGDPADTFEMLREMGTAGVSMAAVVTLVWFGIVLVTSAMEKKVLREDSAERASESL